MACGHWMAFEIVPLDIGDEKSVDRSCGRYRRQGRYPRQHRPSTSAPAGCSIARAPVSVRDEIDQTYLGFVHLAQAFGPAMRMRGADGVNSAAAWVNILSVYALAQLAGVRRLFGVAGRCALAVALLARGTAARRRQGGQFVHRPARHRMVPDGAAAEGRAARGRVAPSCRRSGADWKTCSWAMSPRRSASASRRTPRRSSANWGDKRAC